MVQLARNQVEGGSTVIRLTFKDEAGRFYVPLERSVSFTLFAQNKDTSTWEVVNGRNKYPLLASSVIDIVLQGDDLALLTDCTTKRRVVIDFSYMRGSEVTNGRDMVDFELVPLPVFNTKSPDPIPPILLPLVVKAVFEAGSRIGVIFSEPVDRTTVTNDKSSIYLADSDGEVVSEFMVAWNGDSTIAWCAFVAPSLPVGDYFLYLSSTIKSVMGAGLAAPPDVDGFSVFPINITSTYSTLDLKFEMDLLKEKIDKLDDELSDFVTRDDFNDLADTVNDLEVEIGVVDDKVLVLESGLADLKTAVEELKP